MRMKNDQRSSGGKFSGLGSSFYTVFIIYMHWRFSCDIIVQELSEVIQLPAATGKMHLLTLSGIGPSLLMGEIGLKEGAEPKSS